MSQKTFLFFGREYQEPPFKLTAAKRLRLIFDDVERVLKMGCSQDELLQELNQNSGFSLTKTTLNTTIYRIRKERASQQVLAQNTVAAALKKGAGFEWPGTTKTEDLL